MCHPISSMISCLTGRGVSQSKVPLEDGKQYLSHMSPVSQSDFVVADMPQESDSVMCPADDSGYCDLEKIMDMQQSMPSLWSK